MAYTQTPLIFLFFTKNNIIMKRIHLVFYLLIALLAIACSKSSTDPSKTDMLARTWQVDEAIFQQAAITATAYKKGASSNLADFSKLRLTFNSNGTLSSTDEGGVSSQGTWKFLNSETQLEIKEGTDPAQVFTIGRLSTSNLDVSLAQVSQGATTTITLKLIPL